MLMIDRYDSSSDVISKTSGRCIEKELAVVFEESMEKQEKLEAASDLQIGVELLHAFVLDIVGRHSSAGKIFRIKAGEE